MLSQNEKNKIGLTFSLNDVNFDSNSLNLVPILLNTPEKEEINTVPISNYNLTSMELQKCDQIDLSHNFKQESNESYQDPEIFVQDKSSLITTNYQVPYPTDTSNIYEPVQHHWFYCAIISGLAEWKPFSKIDSKHIESRFLEIQQTESNFQDCVSTDGGRYDVFIENRQKISVYWDEAPMEIRRCSWFYRPEEQSLLLPYSERESELLEQCYRHVLERRLWNEPIQPFGTSVDPRLLEDKFVFHSANTMVEYRRYRDDLASGRQGRVVYRGLEGLSALGIPNGDSSVIDHVVFVLTAGHGRHAVDCAADLRQTISAMHEYDLRNRQARIEVLPVPWQFPLRDHDPSVVSKITGKSVRKLRQFTNEIIFQFLSYAHDDSRRDVLIKLARQMNSLRHRFSSRHPQYDGPVSIAAHGLASMIAFDLIMFQDESFGLNESSMTKSRSGFHLEFEVGHLFALGSPIALLLHCTGERNRNQIPSVLEQFELCQTRGSLFNIFHPLDPLAYRLEPINPQADRAAEPVLIPHYKGRRRLHLELKENLLRVGSDLKTRLIDTLRSTWTTLHEFAASHKSEIEPDERQILIEGHEMLRVLDKDDVDESLSSGANSPDMGRLNKGRRFDYVLQTSPLESFNDYVFALDSHSCYWTSEDTALMMRREIYRETNLPKETKPPILSTPVPRTDLLPPHYRIPSTNTNIPPIFQNVTNKPFFLPYLSTAGNFDNEIDFETEQSKTSFVLNNNDASTFAQSDIIPPRPQYFNPPPVLSSYPPVDSNHPPSSKALSSSSWSPVGSSMRGDGDNADLTTLTGDSAQIDQHDHWNRGELEPEEEGSSFDDSWYLNGQEMLPADPVGVGMCSLPSSTVSAGTVGGDTVETAVLCVPPASVESETVFAPVVPETNAYTSPVQPGLGRSSGADEVHFSTMCASAGAIGAHSISAGAECVSTMDTDTPAALNLSVPGHGCHVASSLAPAKALYMVDGTAGSGAAGPSDAGALQQCYSRYVSPMAMYQSRPQSQPAHPPTTVNRPSLPPQLPMAMQSPLTSVFMPGQAPDAASNSGVCAPWSTNPMSSSAQSSIDLMPTGVPCPPPPVLGVRATCDTPRAQWPVSAASPAAMMTTPPTYRHHAPPPMTAVSTGSMFLPGPADEPGASDEVSIFDTLVPRTAVATLTGHEERNQPLSAIPISTETMVNISAGSTRLPVLPAQPQQSEMLGGERSRHVPQSPPLNLAGRCPISQPQSIRSPTSLLGAPLRSPILQNSSYRPQHTVSRGTVPGTTSGAGPRPSPLTSSMFGATSRPLAPQSGKVFVRK